MKLQYKVTFFVQAKIVSNPLASSLFISWFNCFPLTILSPHIRADLLQNGLVGSPCSPRDSQESSPTPQFKSMLIFNVLSMMVVEGNGTPLQYSCLENPVDGGAWKAAVHGVAEGQTRLNDFTFSFHFHALEKERATHSSVLAWRIPGTGEPAELLSMGSHRVGHDWSDLAVVSHDGKLNAVGKITAMYFKCDEWKNFGVLWSVRA